MLEMLTFSLFELQGILRKEKKKKKGQSTLDLAMVGDGISLKPKLSDQRG
jgi:hypothetical protein